MVNSAPPSISWIGNWVDPRTSGEREVPTLIRNPVLHLSMWPNPCSSDLPWVIALDAVRNSFHERSARNRILEKPKTWKTYKIYFG
jgi:hypothetical protein